MANALFDGHRELVQQGTYDMSTMDTRVVLVDHGVDTPNPTVDDNLDDIAAGARVKVSGDLASKTITDGVYDLSDVTLTGGTSASVESVVIYRHTGTESTSTLLVFIDTATGLPLPIVGGDVTITWDNGANKVYNWLAS